MCSCCDFGLVFCFCCGLCAVLAVTMVWYFVFGQKISKFLEKKCAEIKNVNKKPFSYIIYFFAVTLNSILVLASWSKIQYSSSQILGYFMLFCQVWIARRATRHNLTKPQTFPLEKPRGSYSGLRFSLVFWMSLYKDYSHPSGKFQKIHNLRGVDTKLSRWGVVFI